MNDHFNFNYGDLNGFMILPYLRVFMIMNKLNEFLNQIYSFALNLVNCNVRFIIGLTMGVISILPSLVNYGKFHL